MKIKEITEANQPRVRRVTGSEVEIDQGDGVTTTIDTNKNPNALSKDERTGQVRVQNRNSSQNSNAKQRVKPGDKVDPETLSAN